MEVIKTNLPELTEYCGMKPYEGDYTYETLSAYLHEAEAKLSKRCNELSLRADAMMGRLIRQEGKEGVLELKRDNFNTKLEDCVIGADQQHMLEIIDSHIVPRTGLIYLTPHNNIGRAPFYSSEKIIGPWHIKTLWFNMAMLLLMSIAATVLLLTDCPGRFLRNTQQ